MNTNLIDYINRYVRTHIKTKRDSVLNSLRAAVKQKKTSGINIELMDSAQWIRADMELLFRTVFWADLADDELLARIHSDQRGMPQTIKNRLNLKDHKKIDGLLTELNNRQKTLPTVNKQMEKNDQILKQIIWHQEKLKDLYGAFYVILTKLAHPDPYFTFLADVSIEKEPAELIRMLSSCAREIDIEWCDLEKELLHSKNVNKT
jgi:hypothetical protein